MEINVYDFLNIVHLINYAWQLIARQKSREIRVDLYKKNRDPIYMMHFLISRTILVYFVWLLDKIFV